MRVKLPILLAARLGEIRWDRLRPDDHTSAALRGEVFGDVRGKRRVAALVLGDFMPVHPDLGGVIDRAEMQQQALAGIEPGSFELAAIPAGAVKARVADAAHGRLRRERNLNPDVPREIGGQPESRLAIQREIPRAIQAEPFRPLQ